MLWGDFLSLSPIFIASSFGQGYIGGAQGNCGTGQGLTYIGCYANSDNGPNAGFTFQLSSDVDSVNYYPGYSGLLTPDICTQGCRAHGFKYASIANQNDCFCSPQFPNPTAQESTTEGPGAAEGQNPGNSADVSVCHVSGQGCSGDPSQFCGSSTGADVYVDPSIPGGVSDRQPSNFQYLGCFSSPPPDPFYATLETSSTADCAAYCGLLGYSYIGRNAFDNDAQGPSNNGFGTCGCGTELQAGDQVDETKCNFGCDGSTNLV